MVLAHTIEAMVGDKPARVHCNTCKSKHSYKPNKPGESAAARRREAGATPAAPRGRGNKYQTLLRGKDMAQAKRYSPSTRYSPGDIVEHPNFGVGVATALKDGSKVEVVFEAGMKVLVHER
jgi:hypothetical protein